MPFLMFELIFILQEYLLSTLRYTQSACTYMSCDHRIYMYIQGLIKHKLSVSFQSK